MPFGVINNTQSKAVQQAVQGRVVHDLGAGDLAMAHLLVHLGAKKVVAIDRVESVAVRALKRGGPIEFHHMDHNTYVSMQMMGGIDEGLRKGLVSSPPPRFAQPEKPDVVFMSWPYNLPDQGLLLLASMAKTVIYLGQNLGGSACGFPELFQHFVTRELVSHVPSVKNSLIILGGKLDSLREPVMEEVGALDQSVMLPNLV